MPLPRLNYIYWPLHFRTALFQYSLNCCLPATLIFKRHFISSLLESAFVPKDIRTELLSKNGLPNSLKAFFRWSTSLKNFTRDASFESWCCWTSFLSWYRPMEYSDSSMRRAVSGPTPSYLCNLLSFSVNPIVPPTSLVLPFSCSWLWSSPIFENFRLVFCTVNFRSMNADWTSTFKLSMVLMWMESHLA